jgi:hypothetical protein
MFRSAGASPGGSTAFSESVRLDDAADRMVLSALPGVYLVAAVVLFVRQREQGRRLLRTGFVADQHRANKHLTVVQVQPPRGG